MGCSPFIFEPDLGGGGGNADLDDVVLIFTGATPPIVAGTAIDIQTGVHGGAGSPATVKGDTITLPASAALFNSEARIEVSFNGVELDKGTDPGAVEWVSTTQVRLVSNRIFSGNKLTIKVPA